jgi:hypothetical protein
VHLTFTMLSKRSFGVVLVGGLSQLASTGVAQAQNGGAGQAEASAGVARQVTLSPQEQATQAESFVTRMDSARGAVRRQLEGARAERDVVKVLCLNDKLNQIDVAIRSARERKSALEAAAQRNDADLANHEFTILSLLHQRADQLTTEANQCVGSDPIMIDESSVKVVEEDPMKEDPSEYPSSDVVIEVPSCSSCFK